MLMNIVREGKRKSSVVSCTVELCILRVDTVVIFLRISLNILFIFHHFLPQSIPRDQDLSAYHQGNCHKNNTY